ncbi:MAG: hypothetical protein WA708_09240 [Acidobacteriaceae bacterium]
MPAAIGIPPVSIYGGGLSTAGVLTSVDPHAFSRSDPITKMHGSIGLMRVSEILTPFTLRLFFNFVNGKQRISTGFLPNLPDLACFWPKFLVFAG